MQYVCGIKCNKYALRHTIMRHLKTFQRKKIVALMLMITIVMAALFGRLIYLMVFRSVYYEKIAQDLHERERSMPGEKS